MTEKRYFINSLQNIEDRLSRVILCGFSQIVERLNEYDEKYSQLVTEYSELQVENEQLKEKNKKINERNLCLNSELSYYRSQYRKIIQYNQLKEENEQLKKELDSFEQLHFTDMCDGSRTVLYMKKENGDSE